MYRDSEGRKVEIEDLIKSKAKPKEEIELLNKNRVKEWHGGLAQSREKEESKQRESEILKEGLTVHELPADIERMMAEKNRFGDPMTRLINEEKKLLKKNKGYELLLGKCRHPAPPNRFGIMPGRFWDGRDRSSGYEQKYMVATNDTKAEKQNAYEAYSKNL